MLEGAGRGVLVILPDYPYRFLANIHRQRAGKMLFLFFPLFLTIFAGFVKIELIIYE